ncbi:MAG: gliding motility protein GldN [Bacteroidia bacterium]
MKRLLILFLSIGLYTQLFAQSNVYDDFVYDRNAVQERKVVAWPFLREADVFWAKRIIRIVDVREKQNQPMMWPKNPLSLLLYNSIMSGKLIPYQNDSLSSVYTIEQLYNEKMADTTYTDETDSITGEATGNQKKVPNPFFADQKFKQFKLVEDWIFDKKESVMHVRIIAIAPQYHSKFGGQENPELEDFCYLKYHRDAKDPDKYDIREIIVNQEVFNRANDAARVTYDDWFEQRLFSSYIVKEANQYDRYIKEFAEFKDNKLAAFLEAERIKNDLFEREHDLWEY